MTEDWLEEISRLDQESGQYDISGPKSADMDKCVAVSIKAIENTNRLPHDHIPDWVEVKKGDFWELVDVQPLPQSTLDRMSEIDEKLEALDERLARVNWDKEMSDRLKQDVDWSQSL